MKKLTTINQATISKVTIKATGYVFYAVKSDSTDEMYQLHQNGAGEWKCGCPAVKPCKHERALNEVLDAQVAAILNDEEPAQAPIAEPALVAEMPTLVCPQISTPVFDLPAEKPAPVSSTKELKETLPLNGNRGFSLMKR